MVRRRAARWERVGDHVVVLDGDTQRAHSIDGVAAVAWELLAEPLDRSLLVDAVRARCGSEVSVDEVDSAVDLLRNADLLDDQRSERGIDRRRLLQLGVTAAAGGAAIVTIGLPTPAAALSTGGPAPEFLDTAGYSLSSSDGSGDGSTAPIIQSLLLTFTGTGTVPDYGVITINPNPDSITPITWSLSTPDPNGSTIGLVDIVDFFDEPDRSAWLAATSVRVWFYDSTANPDQFLGQAYFTSPA